MSKTVLANVNGFTPCIDALVKEYDLITAVVFGRVWRYCQMENGVCQASIETIANEIGMSYKTIQRHLDLLVKNGYLEDMTPDLRYKPHTYKDTGKVQVTVDIGAGRSESPTRSVTESDVGRSESPIKIDSKIDNNKIERDSTLPLVEYQQTGHLTNGQVFFRDLFGMKRMNQVQLKAIADLETKYGWADFKAAAEWARLNNFPAGKAISSMTTALPKWGQAKGSNGGDKWAKDRVSKDARSRYAEE